MPARIYLIKTNIGNTRTIEVTKLLEIHQNNVKDIVLLSSLLTLNIVQTLFGVPIVNIEQVNSEQSMVAAIAPELALILTGNLDERLKHNTRDENVTMFTTLRNSGNDVMIDDYFKISSFYQIRRIMVKNIENRT